MSDYLIQGGTLQQIANAIRNKGGTSGLMNAAEMPANILAIPTSAGGETQEKTVDPALTAVTVLPDEGYTLSKVTVNAMPQAEQAVPTLENNNGTINASAVQTAGYVPAGTKTGTLELEKLPATEYTPSLSDQTIPADKYLTGVQTIKAVTGANLQALDADFVAENIKNGVDLFGIVGTYGATGGGTLNGDYSRAVLKKINVTGSKTNISCEIPSDFRNLNAILVLNAENKTSIGSQSYFSLTYFPASDFNLDAVGTINAIITFGNYDSSSGIMKFEKQTNTFSVSVENNILKLQRSTGIAVFSGDYIIALMAN